MEMKPKAETLNWHDGLAGSKKTDPKVLVL